MMLLLIKVSLKWNDKKHMNKNILPVGVFDSGMGGLTVLKALKQQLPHESFIYLGDTARLPYGTKSVETVKQYAQQMAKILVERHIKALVIACNTATVSALAHLQQLLPDMPVVGVVEPGAQAVVQATENHRIMVLATETTIASQSYQRLITAKLPQAQIIARACSLLVALAEEGMTQHIITIETLKHYLAEFREQDTILLGCTHFPVFKPLLQQLLPPHVRVVDSAEATAKATAQFLKEQQLLNDSSATSPLSPPTIPIANISLPKTKTTYLVTDAVGRFQTIGEIFLGEPLDAAHIEMVDVGGAQLQK